MHDQHDGVWAIITIGSIGYCFGAVSMLLVAGLLAVWRRLRGR